MIKFTLNIVYKISYILFESQVCNIITYVSKKIPSWKKKIKSTIIIGWSLIIILNQISTFTK